MAGCKHGECSTAYCPLCGAEIKGTPILDLLAHVRKNAWTFQSQLKADLSEAHWLRKSFKRWESWRLALEKLLSEEDSDENCD